MGAEHVVARRALEAARQTFLDDVASIGVEEALEAGGGLRSILGLIKHTAGWTEVYRSYAFEVAPRSWTEIAWPRGLRERIEPSQAYLDELRTWFERTSGEWLSVVQPPLDLDEPRPVHWGEMWPLGAIVAYVAAHWAYHAGEINAILAIRRSEAWEYGDHVEENHIATLGHSVRRPWMTDDDIQRHEDAMRRAAGTSGT
jgi:hypothetical protein